MQKQSKSKQNKTKTLYMISKLIIWSMQQEMRHKYLKYYIDVFDCICGDWTLSWSGFSEGWVPILTHVLEQLSIAVQWGICRNTVVNQSLLQ